MIVQIYGIRTPEDAAMVARLGADHIGIVVGEHGRLPEELDFATARAVFAVVPPPTVKVALTIATDLDEIEEVARAVRPDILHLSSEMEAPDPAAMKALRARLPDLPLMRAISVPNPVWPSIRGANAVTGPEAVDAALRFQEVSDYLLLDSKHPDRVEIGASGLTHDWSISRQIVEQTYVPVILAGGLSPENVAEAIRAVRPWGVDSFTHTNYPDRPIRKDPERVRAFIEAARSAV